MTGLTCVYNCRDMSCMLHMGGLSVTRTHCLLLQAVGGLLSLGIAPYKVHNYGCLVLDNQQLDLRSQAVAGSC